MAKKSATRKGASKAKKPKDTQEAQSARFMETARAIGVDESGREFDKAMRKIVPPRRAK